MTLLMFRQFDDAALLFTDTLVSDEDGNTVGFELKICTFPEQRMVVAATGNRSMWETWCAVLAEQEFADIEAAAAFTPEALRKIEQFHRDQGMTGKSTIYHFGYQQGTDRLVRYVFSSENDYTAERFTGGQFSVKPGPESFEGYIPDEAAKEGYIELAERIRAEHDGGLVKERCALGGRLIMTRITPEDIDSSILHDFAEGLA